MVDVHQHRGGIQQRLAALADPLMRGRIEGDGEIDIEGVHHRLHDRVRPRQKGQIFRHTVFQHGRDFLAESTKAQGKTEHGADGVAIRANMGHHGNALRGTHGGDDF